MKKLSSIVIIIVVILGALLVLKNQIAKIAVRAAASNVLGTSVTIDSFGIGVFKTGVHIKGFKIYNPKGFPEGVLLDIPEVRVDYDLPALLHGKIHLPLLVLDLKEMVVVKNKEGELNVDALKVARQKEKTKEQSSEEQPKKAPGKIDLYIDEARLNIGQVVVKDYTAGGEEPSVTAYDVNLNNKVYKDIKSAEQFAALVMVEAMGPTAIKGAGIYGAATILGVGFLPAGVASLFIGSDSGVNEFNVPLDKAFAAALEVLKAKGKITQESPADGIIKADVDGAGVIVAITAKAERQVSVKVSARKYMMPKPEIAQGILYSITEKLK